jgi:hypothetical protein
MRFGCFAAAFLLVVPVSNACAQLPGGPHYDTLIGMPSVQKELEIPPPQLRELGMASARNRASMQQIFGLREDLRAAKAHELMDKGDKIIFGLLKPRQKERLRQIQWQQQGCRAFAHTSVIQELSLTQDQQFQINIVLDGVRTHANELLMAPGKPPHPDAIRKHLEKVDRPAMNKIQLVLNTEQKALWKSLLGKPFKGEIRYGPATR